MNKYKITNKILESIDHDKKVVGYMHLRLPVYGKFLRGKDYDYLLSKGKIRFIYESRYQQWLEAPEAIKDNFTVIFATEEFYLIRELNYENKAANIG